MHDPNGNQGDIVSLSAAMTIDTIVEAVEITRVAWTVGSLITESARANESLDQIESQPATPGVDTATIIVHGLNGLYNGQPNGWSKGYQHDLKADSGSASQQEGGTKRRCARRNWVKPRLLRVRLGRDELCRGGSYSNLDCP